MLSSLFRRPLARDITVVLTIKVALIILATIFLFPSSRQPVVNAEIVAQKIFGLESKVTTK